MDFICRSLDVKILVSKPTVEDGLLSDCGSRPSCDNFALESQVKSADVAHNCSNCSVIWSLDAANGPVTGQGSGKVTFHIGFALQVQGPNASVRLHEVHVPQVDAFVPITASRWGATLIIPDFEPKLDRH